MDWGYDAAGLQLPAEKVRAMAVSAEAPLVDWDVLAEQAGRVPSAGFLKLLRAEKI